MFLIKASFRIARFIGSYVVANLQAAMEYRVAFIVQIITMVANDGLWLFFWWTYFRQFPLVNGWQSSNIIVIWAVSACGFGIGMGVFGNTPRLAALIINGGRFDLCRFPGEFGFPGFFSGQYGRVKPANAWCISHIQYLSNEHL